MVPPEGRDGAACPRGGQNRRQFFNVSQYGLTVSLYNQIDKA
jgi:hypothetical protein